VLLTAPWSFHYASPTDAERRAVAAERPEGAEGENLLGERPSQRAAAEQVPGDAQTASEIERADEGKSYFQRCYVDCFYAGPEFRMISIATMFISAGSTGMMFSILIIRDVAGVVDSASQQVHMALISMAFMACACVTSVIIGMSRMERSSRYGWMMLFVGMNSCTEVMIPACAMGNNVEQRLYILYCVSAIKGFGFGGMYNLMQPLTWDAIPEHWKSGVGSVSRATAWISVTRSVGIGVGNFVGGFILDIARAETPEENPGLDIGDQPYPLIGFAALHGFCALVCVIGGWCIQTVTSSKARGSATYAQPAELRERLAEDHQG